MDYLALAIAPGLAIILFILYKDKYNKEPNIHLIVSFILGGIATLPAASFESAVAESVVDGTRIGVAIFAYGVVAFSEEFTKFLGLRLYSYTRKCFDEPLDGIVYSVMVGMGFATVENILYVYKGAELGQGYSIALQRMFLSVPAHATFAVVMGYFVGKAKFNQTGSFKLMLIGLLGAVFFHGTYDFCLFLNQYSYVDQNTGEGILLGGAIISLIVALTLSRNLIRQQRKISQQMFSDKNNLSV